jgi:hypothetical protein
VFAFAKVSAPVVVPVPVAAGVTPVAGLTAHTMVPPVPPVTLNDCVPPAVMVVGADGEMDMAVGCEQEAAFTS